ncbi:hypothetical protein PRZ48_002572 [Zasmidium cellare]|uniref:Major facilitator superfamily (MFS) profile domain-containing protein n=1 Tax=Zasmidium cellare TaxID=395010 RepID=A0ABR0ETU0_ZASCE|nr:hypothetical protein PRZ48_002572 [Zasmidium cellare]
MPADEAKSHVEANDYIEDAHDMAKAANAVVLNPIVSHNIDDNSLGFSKTEERRCLRRLDLWLLPFILFTYALQYTDKVILNGASQFGIVQDLHLYEIRGYDPRTHRPIQDLHRYSLATLIFYWGYLAGVLPAAFLAQKLPLGKFLSATVVLWGAVTMLTVTVSSYPGFMVQRFFLGVCESGVGPGFSLVIAMFWKRDEQPLRYAIWYVSNGIGAFVGPMLVYGIGHIHGSLRPWKYQYLILGGLTVIWGALMVVVLPDNPRSARFLKDREREVAIARIQSEQLSEENKIIKVHQIVEALKDPKTWLTVVSTFCVHFVNGACSGFGAIIVRSFGYGQLKSVLLTGCAGLYLLAILIIAGGVSSHFRNSRTYIWCLTEVPVIIGAALIWKTSWTSERSAALAGFFLLFTFAPAYTMLLSLVGSNTGGYTKKVFMMGLIWSVYCISNGVAPLFVQTTEVAEQYPSMFKGVIVTASISLCCALAMRLYLVRENKKRDQSSNPDSGSGIAEDMTDRENAHFRYAL